MQNWMNQYGFTGNFNFMNYPYPFYTPTYFPNPEMIVHQNDQHPFETIKKTKKEKAQTTKIEETELNYKPYEKINENEFSPSQLFKVMDDQDDLLLPKKKKYAQKDSRNVVSNILRIFFKNLVDLKLYDASIMKIMAKYNYTFEIKIFYRWVKLFRVDFRNYIKVKELKKLMAEERYGFYKIFRVLLKFFIDEYGWNHCLTSKRMNETTRRMHLKGLRELKKDAFQLKAE